MKRLVLLSLSAILIAGSAYAHAVDFTARPETYASTPRHGYFVMTPIPVRPVYVNPAVRYGYAPPIAAFPTYR